MIPISIGVMAHNEERNISRLLDSLIFQDFKSFRILEIIVISSGSSDKTDDIVKHYSAKYEKVKLVSQRERQGKCSAINIFLELCKSDLVVLQSGDTFLERDSIEKLCKPLLNDNIGIVASHPVPFKNSNYILGKIVDLQWRIHHRLSLKYPKFGELIAFKKVFSQIPESSVDEEEIANQIFKKGYRASYSPSSIVHNHGPSTFRDFIEQRKRIYAGHLRLKKRTSYCVKSLDNRLLFEIWLKEIKHSEFFVAFLALFFEGIARAIGYWQSIFEKDDDVIWKTCLSTKHSFVDELDNCTILIPTLNEENNIGHLLDFIIREYHGIHIIVADDGSVDKTKDVVTLRANKYPGLTFLDRSLESIHGLTISILSAISKCDTKYFIVMDGDYQHPPEAIRDFMDVLPIYDLVVGKRRSVKSWHFMRKIMSYIATFIAKIIILSKSTKCDDLMSGFFGGKTILFKKMINNNYQAFELEGYKVLFDFLKHNSEKLDVKNIEYNFGLREFGSSKIGLYQIKAFIRSLFR